MEILEIVGAVIGLVYLYLEYKADKWLWLFSVIMPVIYIVLFYRSKFYADMGINVYYLFAGIYGWMKWTKGHRSAQAELVISHTPLKAVVPLSVVALALFGAIAWVLIRFTDSPVPYGDAFTTALSVMGMWMLANKFVEHWGIWLVVNTVSCALYFWKELYYTGGLFVVYVVISVLGYLKWRKMMREVQYG